GPEPVHGTLEDRLTEIRDRRDSCQAAAFLDRLSKVDEHDDAGLYRHAEAGDVAGPDGHAEVEPEEPLEDCSPGQRSQDARHHEQDVDHAVIGQVEDQDNDADHEAEDELESLPCPHLMFELAGPLDVPAGG